LGFQPVWSALGRDLGVEGKVKLGWPHTETMGGGTLVISSYGAARAARETHSTTALPSWIHIREAQ
jgi:hypothetical protein